MPKKDFQKLIKKHLTNHLGYSQNEKEMWLELAKSQTPENQEKIYNFLEEKSDELKTDYYELFKKEGILEELEQRYLEAQMIFASDEEVGHLIAATAHIEGDAPKTKTLSQKEVKEIETAIIKKMKTDDDIINLLVTLGPDGIKNMEISLANQFIAKKTDIELEELIKHLHDLCKIKNTITDSNIKYMEEAVKIYTQGLKWMDTQRQSANERADLFLHQIINQ